MSDLTDDEYTVLMLADQGNFMAPIGRWEKPIRDLHARGLLDKRDDVNYVANVAGRAALAVHEKGIDDGLRNVIENSNKAANARTTAQQSVEQAALHLSFAAKASSLVTGDTPAVAVKLWVASVEKRALELVEQ